MKAKTCFFIIFVMTCSAVFAQDKVRTVFEKAEKLSLERIDISVSDSLNFFFPMSFSNKEFISTLGLARIKPENIASIELFYTDFPKGKNFDKLNLSRFQKLYEVAPIFFDANHIQWKIVAQTNCENKKQAEDLFHGFVLRKKTKTEITKTFTDKPKISIAELAKKDPVLRDSLKFRELIAKNIIPTGDSIVFKVLERLPKWENILIVNDWTGSMYEFGLEVLLWYKIKEDRQKDIKKVVFFNDGDTLPDRNKVIGKTGGIYQTSDSISIKHILDKMVACMRGGYGGDIPENDIEAIIKGLESCPNCEEVILIADSRSRVRDMVLANQITKPVHVILCGAATEVVQDYVMLAMQTGGTIHVIEQDVMDIKKHLVEGKLFEFAGVKMIFFNGKFEVYEPSIHAKKLLKEDKKKIEVVEKITAKERKKAEKAAKKLREKKTKERLKRE